MIIVDRDSYDELFTAQDSDLNFVHAILENYFDFRCVFRADIFNEVHINVIRYDLNRAIPSITSSIVDEVTTTIDEILDPLVTEGKPFPTSLTPEWTPIVAFPMLCKIICRETHRVLVGLPLCRDKDYIDYVDQHSKNVVIATQILRLLPEFFRGYFLSQR